jgi:uncharacterized membrane protein
VLAAGLALWLAPRSPAAADTVAQRQPVSFGAVEHIVQARCVMCHNAQLSNKNVALHTPELIRQHAQQVYQQVAVLKLMPLNNATQITDVERGEIKRWFESGASSN